MGTGLFRIKRPGRGVEHPPTSCAEVKERVELYLYSPSGPSWPVIGRALHLTYYSCLAYDTHCTLVGTNSEDWLIFSEGTNSHCAFAYM